MSDLHHYSFAPAYDDEGLQANRWKIYCVECSEARQDWVTTCEKAAPRDAPEYLYDHPEDS